MANMQHFRGNAARDRALSSNETVQWDGGYHVTANGLRIEHCEPTRTHQLKPGRTFSEGQYTRVSLIERRHELILFRSLPNLIYRNDPVGSNPPIAILQKIDEAFAGTQGLDIDAAIKRPLVKRQGKSTHSRGKSACEKKALAMKPTSKKVLSSVQYC